MIRQALLLYPFSMAFRLSVGVAVLVALGGSESRAQELSPQDDARAAFAAMDSSAESSEVQQEDETPDDSASQGRFMAIPEKDRSWLIDPRDMRSLFFTEWTHRLILEQRRVAESLSAVGPSDVIDDTLPEEEEKPRGPRNISLGGIVFVSPEEWTIWLNEQRIMPGAVPKEVMGLNVSKDYIEIRWYDSFTNIVYPVRLRPNQRFNIDSRIFLPG